MIDWTPGKIRKLRKEYNLTRKQLSNYLGVTDRTIYFWKNDMRKPSKPLKILLSRIENDLKKGGE